jgi:hypothetical protein
MYWPFPLHFQIKCKTYTHRCTKAAECKTYMYMRTIHCYLAKIIREEPTSGNMWPHTASRLDTSCPGPTSRPHHSEITERKEPSFWFLLVWHLLLFDSITLDDGLTDLWPTIEYRSRTLIYKKQWFSVLDTTGKPGSETDHQLWCKSEYGSISGRSQQWEKDTVCVCGWIIGVTIWQILAPMWEADLWRVGRDAVVRDFFWFLIHHPPAQIQTKI